MINRRQFLVVSGLTLVSVTACESPTNTAVNSPTISLGVFDKAQGEMLLHLSRTLFPHDFLQDGYYLACVESFDQNMGKNPALAATIKRDLASLANTTPDFTRLPPEEQRAAVTTFQDSDLFASLKQHLVIALYNNPDVWPHFGYQGPSFSQGGYLQRGFDDINWIPRP